MTLEMKAARIEALTALRDRLAAATGPDWQLSVDIELAFVEGAVRATGGGTYAVWRDGRLYNPPAYTASIDAAVTLVPKDFTAWRVGQGSIAWAVIGVGQYTIDYRDFTVQAATPALALALARIDYELAAIAGRKT